MMTMIMPTGQLRLLACLDHIVGLEAIHSLRNQVASRYTDQVKTLDEQLLKHTSVNRLLHSTSTAVSTNLTSSRMRAGE